MLPEEVLARIRALGFAEEDAALLADHFLDAERRGKLGHGLARLPFLESLPGLDPQARPERVASGPGFERWEARGALGYLTLAAICAAVEADPPAPARVIAAGDCFPTGALGYWVRRLARAGLVAVLTATSPARLAHPGGGEPLAGTNPLAIGLPNAGGEPIVGDVSMGAVAGGGGRPAPRPPPAAAPPGGGGEPIVVDVSMGAVTYGDVLSGAAAPEDLVPFGGKQAHKAFALAVGLQGLVESFVGERFGAVLLVAQPEEAGFAARLRERAAGLRLPGDA